MTFVPYSGGFTFRDFVIRCAFKKVVQKKSARAERHLSHPRARAPAGTLFRGNSSDSRGSANPAGQKAQSPNDAPLFPRIREPSGAGISPDTMPQRVKGPADRRRPGSMNLRIRESVHRWIRESMNRRRSIRARSRARFRASAARAKLIHGRRGVGEGRHRAKLGAMVSRTIFYFFKLTLDPLDTCIHIYSQHHICHIP